MSDNTVLNPGAVGDTIRTLQRSTGTVKTEVVQIDAGGAAGFPESLVGSQNPLPVTDAGGGGDHYNKLDLIYAELRLLTNLITQALSFQADPDEYRRDKSYLDFQ